MNVYFYKLRKIVRAVRSSPQRKESWLALVSESIKKDIAELKALQEQLKHAEPAESKVLSEKLEDMIIRKVLAPILDVRTRWLSTHQMLGKFTGLSLATCTDNLS